VDGEATCPLPEEPTLAEVAQALNETGQWAEIVDAAWRCAYLTDEGRLMFSGWRGLVPYPVGVHFFGPEAVDTRMGWEGGQFPLEINRKTLATFGGFALADTPGGRAELRELVDPRLRDIVEELVPKEAEASAIRFQGLFTAAGGEVHLWHTMLRVRDREGRLVGTVFLSKPTVGMATLMRVAAIGDPRHYERMNKVARPARRPAALLFGDLESSGLLSRRLSTANFFTLVRRIVREADRCLIDAGGIVGRHAGDGVVGFFLAETAGSEASAALSCIQAAYAIRDALPEVAHRSGVAASDVRMRFGLHWGATLYVGQIATSGRTELNALGDEVNEAARIEACASGGRILASKALVERIDLEEAAVLGINVDHLTYTLLSDLPTATEKARRDAPAIAVCEL
jgi:class 3 adenylate cyclase